VTTNDGRDPIWLSETAAENIRIINRSTILTRDAGGYSAPGELFSTVLNLATLAQRLPQLLQQASSWLEREDEHDRLYHDGGASSMQCSLAVGGALTELDNAVRFARMLEGALDGAANRLSHLGQK